MCSHVDQAFWDFVSTWDSGIGIDTGITWHSALERFTGGVDKRLQNIFLVIAEPVGLGWSHRRQMAAIGQLDLVWL
jgi:hypothetical protein